MLRNYTLPKRGKLVNFRLSADEYAALEHHAKDAGLTVSALLRATLAAVISERGRIRKRPRQPRDTAQTVAMLARIHRNMQELQRWVETHTSGVDAVSIMAHLVALEQELDRMTTTLEQRG